MGTLLVFARYDLLGPQPAEKTPALLLEGSWPQGADPSLRWSLDDAIDARFAWIDREASRLAERLAEPWLLVGRGQADPCAVNPAWLYALGLRYYLVKLLRLVAFFSEVRPLAAGQLAELVAARGRDEDYAHCLAQLCRLAGAVCRVEWVDWAKQPPCSFPPSSSLRRLLGRWASRIARTTGFQPASRSPDGCPTRPLSKIGSEPPSSPRRVILCGNPRVLDAVCCALVERNCRVWWLYDRFAVRCWLRWCVRGVGQLTCQSSGQATNRLDPPPAGPLECRGVDLAAPAQRWIAERLATQGAQQTRLLEQIDGHFRQLRPDALVLDEDATPMARAAVAAARRQGVASLVVQHGAPMCRFGFAPPAADRILVWGQSSQSQLVAWGVPPQRIFVVGSPRHKLLGCGQGKGGRRGGKGDRRIFSFDEVPSSKEKMRLSPFPPRILLLATVPPRDQRPDAVTLHLTRRTHGEMLRAALGAVSALPGAELIVKLHPRAPHDPAVHAAMRHFPGLRSRVVRRGPVEPWLAWADCVLSCLSSAGIEAALAGVPAIQLLPAGSGEVSPHEHWGMLGTARSEAELRPLLLEALCKRASSQSLPRRAAGFGVDPRVFEDLGASAAARIADMIGGLGKRSPCAAREGPEACIRTCLQSSTRLLAGGGGGEGTLKYSEIPSPLTPGLSPMEWERGAFGKSS